MAKKLLYVEDNPGNVLLVRRIVETDGFEFLSAGVAGSGQQLARSEALDRILLDLYLPGGISGIDLTYLLKEDEATKDIPVESFRIYP